MAALVVTAAEEASSELTVLRGSWLSAPGCSQRAVPQRLWPNHSFRALQHRTLPRHQLTLLFSCKCCLSLRDARPLPLPAVDVSTVDVYDRCGCGLLRLWIPQQGRFDPEGSTRKIQPEAAARPTRLRAARRHRDRTRAPRSYPSDGCAELGCRRRATRARSSAHAARPIARRSAVTRDACVRYACNVATCQSALARTRTRRRCMC